MNFLSQKGQFTLSEFMFFSESENELFWLENWEFCRFCTEKNNYIDPSHLCKKWCQRDFKRDFSELMFFSLQNKDIIQIFS